MDPDVATWAHRAANSFLTTHEPDLRVANEALFYATLACQCAERQTAAMQETLATARAAAAREAQLPKLSSDPADDR
jgi:hypothetical protein